MLCPSCGHRLLRKSGAKVKLRVPILVFDEDGGNATSSCPNCKEEIQVAVTLEKSAIPTDTPLVLGKRRLTPNADDP